MNTAVADMIARREEVLERIRRMLIVSLGLRRDPGEIDPDTSLFGTGLGIDSVDAVEIVVALEIDFGLKLTEPVQRRIALRNVNTLVDVVLSHEEAKRAAP